MSVFLVSVKWGKEKYENLRFDLSAPLSEFCLQIYSLTTVPPERQKIMFKGKVIKEESLSNLEKLGLKNGQILLLMGTAETQKIENFENLNEPFEQNQQIQIQTSIYPPGLCNLGNTCYLNSTLQCMNAINELHKIPTNTPLSQNLIDLFGELNTNQSSIIPITFVSLFRAQFPMFAQMQGNNYLQQDAEECWSTLITQLSNQTPVVKKLFAIETSITLQCNEETQESIQVMHDESIKLLCHITNSTNHLMDGIKQSMEQIVKKHSITLNREASYKQTSRLSKLPRYIAIQLVRFTRKTDVNVTAKILRQVTFPKNLDVFEICSSELQQKITNYRNSQEENSSNSDITQTTENYENLSGQYELVSVISHQGRSAEGGHYIAWVRQSQDTWLKFDDAIVSLASNDEINRLQGGVADSPMAYVCFYATKH
eukprot:TRINITY_DN1925_c0_g1_i1.p1 TRINITY_DN1925_c0_g1~~TRINITY_DN1925_c0_g1_i1.p1  ORF type:complete len:428 (-),score=157.61 TRINITY_DN1925_c0_g1_i1:89-1372(-)